MQISEAYSGCWSAYLEIGKERQCRWPWDAVCNWRTCFRYGRCVLLSGRHSPKQTSKQNFRHGLKIYIAPKIIGHTVRIGNKFPSCIQRPKVIWTAFPSLFPDMRSNIHCKPQKFALDPDSFTIGIDNHESTSIYNWSSHFIGTITPVKGKMVKDFVRVVQGKGEGAIICKIEDDDGIVHPIKIKKAL